MLCVFRQVRPLILLSGALTLAYGESLSLEKQAGKILQAKCLACHGQARMSDLDLRESARRSEGRQARSGGCSRQGRSRACSTRPCGAKASCRCRPGKTALTAAEVNDAPRLDQRRRAIWTCGAEEQPPPSWWSFRKPVRPAVPAVKNAALGAQSDRRLHPGEARSRRDCSLAPTADRRTLARRAYFDLHGLPPTPEQVEQFVNDKSPDAYEKLIDRLLASPRYGERWGRYWLDLVRYADTSGFRDRSLLHHRLAVSRLGDQVVQHATSRTTPSSRSRSRPTSCGPRTWIWKARSSCPKEKEENVHRRIGTSLFTLGSFPIEYTYYGDQFRAEWQADAVDTVGAAFLGPHGGLRALPRSQVRSDQPARLLPHDRAVRRQRRARDSAGQPVRCPDGVAQFSAAGAGGGAEADGARRRAAAACAAARTQRQAGGGAGPECRRLRAPRRRSDPQRAALLQQLGEAYLRAPERMPHANVLAHDESFPTRTSLLKGDFKNKGEKVEPGFLSALNPGPPIVEPKGVLFVPQRRKALALWLTSPDNPLLGRVMVNRIWQGHFGEGIVAHAQRFRPAGRAADASRVARLAGRRVRRARLEHQADAPADHAVEHVPAVERRG